MKSARSGRSQRTLRIQLPGAGDTENHLAAGIQQHVQTVLANDAVRFRRAQAAVDQFLDQAGQAATAQP